MHATLERAHPIGSRRFDVSAHHRMPEAVILAAKERVELIDEEVLNRRPTGDLHAGTVIGPTRFVARAVADGLACVSAQGPLRLNTHNEPQPDPMLLRSRAACDRQSHPTAADILLLIEVAGSSLAYDREPKLTLYAGCGVPEVWIGSDGKSSRDLSGARTGGVCHPREAASGDGHTGASTLHNAGHYMRGQVGWLRKRS